LAHFREQWFVARGGKESPEKQRRKAHRYHARPHFGVLVMPESLDNEGAMARNSLAREGVNVLSEDEWDERFGWAASTGLRPSLLRKLETSATEYLEALRNKASNLEEKRACLLDGLSSANLLHRELSDGVFYQLEELGHRNLKICVDDPESVFLSEGTS
jgi:hypothetical protein